MRRLLLALSALLLSLLLTGCLHPTQLDERLLVQAVGVDYERATGHYAVTVQTFSPEGGGATGNFDPNALNNQVYGGEGESIAAALREIGRQTGKSVFLGSNRLVVVAEEAADSRLPQILGYFSGNHEVRPKTALLISRGAAADVVSAQVKQSIVPAAAVQRMVQRAGEEGLAADSSILSAVGALWAGEECAAVAYVDTRAAGEETAVELLGAAVVDAEGIRLHLTPEECRGAAWLRGDISAAALPLDDGRGGRYTLLARPELHLLTARMEGGAPVLELRLRLQCTLTEALRPNGAGVSPRELPALRALTADRVEAEIDAAFEKLLEKNRADIFHAARYLEKFCPRHYRAHAGNPDALFGPLRLETQVEVDISALGLGGGAAQS